MRDQLKRLKRSGQGSRTPGVYDLPEAKRENFSIRRRWWGGSATAKISRRENWKGSPGFSNEE